MIHCIECGKGISGLHGASVAPVFCSTECAVRYVMSLPLDDEVWNAMPSNPLTYMLTADVASIRANEEADPFVFHHTVQGNVDGCNATLRYHVERMTLEIDRKTKFGRWRLEGRIFFQNNILPPSLGIGDRRRFDGGDGLYVNLLFFGPAPTEGWNVVSDGAFYMPDGPSWTTASDEGFAGPPKNEAAPDHLVKDSA